MKNFFRFYFFWLFFALSLSPTITLAAGSPTLHKFAGVEMGYGTFFFNEKLDHKIVFPAINLTAGLAYSRYSLVFNTSGSLDNADISEEEQTGYANREDFDLTAGYQLSKPVSIFIGYKQGQSKLTLINRLTSVSGNEYYKQNGPYIGFNYNWKNPNAGKLDLTLAYAYLNASNNLIADGDAPDDPPELDDVTGKTSGHSDGYSISISWSMPIKGNLIFRSRLKVNQYLQDITFEGNKYNDVAEGSTMLSVGITSIF